MQIEEPGFQLEPFPVLRLGFRPFYLAASVFAVLSVPIWLGSYLHYFPSSNISLYWHVHEMVFGFCTAVVVGFLFTAARNWTGLWTPRGWTLSFFVILWLIGRIATATNSACFAALCDLPFIPAAAYVLFRVMVQSGKRRNLPLTGILALLFFCNVWYHCSTLGIVRTSGILPLHMAVLLIAVLSTIMGTRVIPSFTASATGREPIRQKFLDTFALTAIAACFATSLCDAPGWIVMTLSIVGAVAHFLRMRGWGLKSTARFPLLWILHLSFLCLGLGILLLGVSSWMHVSKSSAFHVLSIGAVSSLIVGMMARTTRGHTGQKMVSSLAEVTMFSSIQLAGILRLCANFSDVGLRQTLLATSGALWCLTFLIFLGKFGGAMFRPRVDGREG